MLGANEYTFRHFSETLRGKEFPQDINSLLERAKSLGLSGLQISGIKSFQEAKLREISKKAEDLGMYLEITDGSPTPSFTGYNNFEKWVEAAEVMGCEAIRTYLDWPPRGYDSTKTLSEIKSLIERAKKELVETEKLARKHKVKVGIENHMDLTGDELLEIMKKVGSEYLGICFDTANSLWTAEDPLETAKKLAPYTKIIHLKDYRITWTEEGFIFNNVPLGQGHVTQLPEIVNILKKEAKLERFSIELITDQTFTCRWLDNDFWKSFPPRPAEDLAKMLRLVRDTPRVGWKPAEYLEFVSSLGKKIADEEYNIRQCVKYAKEVLKI
jgi:sugar phosphate isomerase/epimerase